MLVDAAIRLLEVYNQQVSGAEPVPASVQPMPKALTHSEANGLDEAYVQTRIPTRPSGWLPPSQRMQQRPLQAPPAAAPSRLMTAPTGVSQPYRPVGPLGWQPPLRPPDSPITSVAPPLSRSELSRSRFAVRARATVAFVALMGAGGSYLAVSDGITAGNRDACTDVRHALIKVGSNGGLGDEARKVLDMLTPFSDGRQWSEVATDLSDERGYLISGDRLAAANVRAVPVDAHGDKGDPVEMATQSDGHIRDTIRVVGRFCVSVPAPLAAGQVETAEGDTIMSLAQRYLVNPSLIRKFNPNLPKGDATPLPEASVVWVADKPDTSLVLQELKVDSLGELVKGEPNPQKAAALLGKILLANKATLSSATIGKGDHVYAPLQVTDDMESEGIEPKEIIQGNAGAYDPAEHNKPANVPDPGTRPTPEQKDAGSVLPNANAYIDALEASAAQKAFLKRFAEAIVVMRRGTDARDICLPVTIAQAIHETGWGRSELARRYNNYFGMKTGSDWRGQVVQVETVEHVAGRDIRVKAPFRVYDSLASSLTDHVHKINEATWYSDARRHPEDPGKYLDGLLNELDSNGAIVTAMGQKGAMSYATDPRYKEKVLRFVDSLGLVRLVQILDGQEAVVVPKSIAGPIRIDPKRYSEVQSPLIPNTSGKSFIDADNNPANGKEARSKRLTQEQRIRVIERELNEAHAKLSAGGYEEFKQNMRDVRGRVRRAYPYFRGEVTGLGAPKSLADVNYFIVHFTATRSAATGYDGFAFAGSMHHAGQLGVQYNINDRGQTYWLTGDYVFHTKDFRGINYNAQSYGVEVSATDQSDVNALQYEAIAYWAAHNLIEGGHVQKGKPFQPILDKMVKGHREANAAVGMHHDFPGVVMDPVRVLVATVLEQQGYSR